MEYFLNETSILVFVQLANFILFKYEGSWKNHGRNHEERFMLIVEP